MSKNSTFVDTAIYCGIHFGSAGGAVPDLREERSEGIFWRDGAAAGWFGRLLAAVSSAFQVAGRGYAAISGRFSSFLRTVMWYYRV